jgi:hypothetical protein
MPGELQEELSAIEMSQDYLDLPVHLKINNYTLGLSSFASDGYLTLQITERYELFRYVHLHLQCSQSLS